MAYETKDFSGALFENTERESSKHPHIKGTCLIDGVEYWISGWNNVSKNGGEYISLAFKKKEAKAAVAHKTTAAPKPLGSLFKSTPAPATHSKATGPGASGFDDLDDDIPF